MGQQITLEAHNKLKGMNWDYAGLKASYGRLKVLFLKHGKFVIGEIYQINPTSLVVSCDPLLGPCFRVVKRCECIPYSYGNLGQSKFEDLTQEIIYRYL